MAIVGGEAEDGPIARHLVQVSICSGVVLARDVVITAAHCATGRVQWRDASGALRASPTIEAAIHPSFRNDAADPQASLLDLALLRIADPLLEDRSPARLSEAPPWPGDDGAIIGYGESIQGQADSAGVLRSGDVTVARGQADERVVWLEREGRVGACKGDSGGALAQREMVAGIITSIMGRCGLRTRAVLLGPQRDWIDAVLTKWDRAALWERVRR